MTPDEVLSRARVRWNRIKGRTVKLENDVALSMDRQSYEALQMLPDLITLAERQQEMLVEVTAEKLYPFNMPTWEHLPEREYTRSLFSGEEIQHGKSFYRAQARQELSIQKRPRLSELEQDAIEHAISSLDQWSDTLEDEMAIKVLRKMLEE